MIQSVNQTKYLTEKSITMLVTSKNEIERDARHLLSVESSFIS